MSKKRLLSIFTSMACVVNICGGVQILTADAVSVSDEMHYGDYLYYMQADEFEDGIYDYVIITDCDESVMEIDIPGEIDGLPVIDISSSAFAYCSDLESVTIPDSVTSIGYEAFGYCSSLESVIIPDGVTNIASNAFSGTPLLNNQTTDVKYVGNWVIGCDKDVTSVEIKEETRGIAGGAFCYCESLTSISIPDDVTNIGDCAFEYCTSLESITMPDKVTSIGYGTFEYCASLKSIIIPDGVTSIGDSAFCRCSCLESITIPDSVTSIASNAFSDTPLLNNQTTDVKYVGNWVIDCDEDVTSAEIKEETRGIADGAFRYCESLTSINMPDSVTNIGYGAFYHCSSLENLTIPCSVTSIGHSAFGYCTSLESITIPDSVTSIGDMVFTYCSSLTSINVSVDNVNYNDIEGVLLNKTKTELIAYPIGRTDSEYVVPDSVTSIVELAFTECRSLKCITIPDSVTSIESMVFRNCTSLESITIENPECEIYDSKDTISDTAVIYGYENSTAQEYAEKYGYKFAVIGSEPEILKGDADGNGKIAASDAAFIARTLAQASISGDKITVDDYPAADYNGDGKISAQDASAIAKYLAENAFK